MYTGGDSVGKTSLLLEIAEFHPESRCVIFDWENKTRKVLDSLYYDLKNVEVIPVRTFDGNPEAAVLRQFEKIAPKLKSEDWFMIDGLDKAWDVAQTEYDPKKGPDQWQWIKGVHNKEWLDVACGFAPFNVAATAWAAPNDTFNIDREKDAMIREELMMWQQYGFRPGGEKRNTSRFDTIFALKTSVAPVKRYVSTYKDKGARPYLDGGDRSLWMEFDFPFWPIYVEACKAEQARLDSVEWPAGRRKPRVILPE
jgi:hypothetical protein